MSTAEQAQDVAADLYMVVNKLTAEMQLIHAALTAAGSTGPSTLSERVKALSSAFNAVSRERDNYIAQARVAHHTLNNATVKTSGNLDGRVAQIVEKYKALETLVASNSEAYARGTTAMHVVIDGAMPGTLRDTLKERVWALVEKYKALEAENKELRASLVCAYPSIPIAPTTPPPKETTITIPAGGSVRVVVEKG